MDPAVRTIQLEGDPYQIGLSHGRLLSAGVQHLRRQVDQFVFRRLGRVRGTAVRAISAGLCRAMERYIPESYRQEMRGIARGSGVGYGDVLLLNCLDDVLNVFRRVAPPIRSQACSSFVLLGSRTADGRLIHGRNLDYHFRNTPLDDGGGVARLLHKWTVLFSIRPTGRAAFLSVGWPGMAGAQTSINEHGLALGNLTSYAGQVTPLAVPTGFIYRQMAEGASTLREASAILRAARRTMGNNLMVSSGRESSAALFEFLPDAVAEISPRNGFLASTNHFNSPALAHRQRHYLLPHSVDRWRRLNELLARGAVTVEEGCGFLADTTCATTEDGKKTLGVIANEGTAVSVLFRPELMELWMGVSRKPPASHGEWMRLDAASLLAGRGEGPGEPQSHEGR